MLLSKNVDIRINNINKKHYINFFKDIKTNDIINVSVDLLTKGSKVKVDVKCDDCGIEKNMPYSFYYKFALKDDKDGKYYCTKCVKIHRTQKTMLDKYNVKFPIQNKNIKDKILKTTNDRYGFDYALKNDTIKEKQKNTNLKKYNVPYVSLDENIRNKQSYNDIEKVIKLKCNKGHTFSINRNNLYNRYIYKSEICTKCNTLSHQSSGKENIIYDFIKENYNEEVIINLKNLINPYELDIYLPELKLAFEFNGLYWHNELHKSNNYHKIKSDLCDEKGIQLIHIYEDDWDNKQDIVKSMILNKLGKSYNKIYARKTEVKEIKDNELIRNFLNKNHIQGFVGSAIKIGLFYEDELISLMTFGKLRKPLNSLSKKDEYEMLRFCNKLNTSVIGGASKLFKYFLRNYKINSIITYADRSYSNGKLYKLLGFKLDYITCPNYYYVINREKKYRYNYRKDILVKQGFDSNKTEHEIMLERKIYRIYNSGNYKFIYNLAV